MQSTDFQMDESYIGNGGSLQSQSANYKSINSVGDTAIGRSASTNFQDKAGSVTNGDPVLGFSLTSSQAQFSNFSSTATATASTEFTVIDYTSYGYVVQITGSPPKNGAYSLPAMAGSPPNLALTPTIGQEEFGLNLVKNTTPNVGNDPDHGDFGFGSASTGYDTANKFRYVSGETVASSPKSSGNTTYTISFIANVKDTTPAGQYISDQTIIVTGTY